MRNLIAFFVLMLAAFAPLPINGRLPGNTDTLLAIALSNQIWESFLTVLTGLKHHPTVLYPAVGALPYGENCYGLAAIFIFFKQITRSDIWGYYLFISTLFALNGYAIARIGNRFCKNKLTAFLAGLVFCSSGFVLGNIDDPNVIFVFFPVMAFDYLLDWLETRNDRKLGLALFFMGSQIWFGFYFFAYQFLMFAVLIFCNLKIFSTLLKSRNWLRPTLAFLIPVTPLLIVYYYNYNRSELTSIYAVFKDCSLQWINFLHRLPNNIIYPNQKQLYLDWVEIRKNCFPGLLLPIGALLGSVYLIKNRIPQTKFLLLTGSIFLFLSFGANNPLLSGYDSLPIIAYLRVPSRYYLVTFITLSIFFGVGVESIAAMVGDRKIGRTIAVAFGALFVLENMPYPLFSYEYASVIRPGSGYVDFFKKSDERKIILDLPSTIYFKTDQAVYTADRLWFFNREALYMNWQTYHKQIIVGGANGYVPRNRIFVEDVISDLPRDDSILKIKELGIEYIVFHKDMVLFKNEDILEELRNKKSLKVVSEDERDVIFEIRI